MIFSPVVIAPTYNNARTIGDILQRVQRLCLPVIVINDGSTDDTAQELAAWASSRPADKTMVLTHAANQGKAAAMHTGFRAALDAGHTHAVTIDTDGQLNPEEIPALLRMAEKSPNALVLGVRREVPADCPRANRLGWWMSALGIWLETGWRVLDSQCGLRVYPLRLIENVPCRAGRYGFETEIITRAAWAGYPVIEVPVTCKYFLPSERVSHFRPLRDGFRSFLMHARLTLRRLNPWPTSEPRTSVRADVGGHEAPCDRKIAVRLVWSLVWRRLRRDRFEQLIVAAAFGIGAFLAAMPLGGWQIPLSLHVAVRLHVPILPVLFAPVLCLTPVGTLVSKAAIAIGYLLLHARWPDFAALDPASFGHWTLLSKVPVAWPLGALILGLLLNWITLGVLVQLFRLIPVRELTPESPAARR